VIKKIQITVDAVFCDECKKDLMSYDGNPYWEKDGKHYCEMCALKSGAMSPLEYAQRYNPWTRKYYAAELVGDEIRAYYKCKTKKGYRVDRWGLVLNA
jgi:hypothetical protein